MRYIKSEEDILEFEKMRSETGSVDIDSTEDETDISASNLSTHNNRRQHRKLNSSRWTPEEDDRLKQLVKQFGPKTWHLVAKHMSTATTEEQHQLNSTDGTLADMHTPGAHCEYSQHTAVQCMCRYKNVLDVCVRKGPWTEEEDDILKQLVAAAPGPHKIKWREVAEHLSGRLGKQCRERWYVY